MQKSKKNDGLKGCIFCKVLHARGLHKYIILEVSGRSIRDSRIVNANETIIPNGDRHCRMLKECLHDIHKDA